MNASRNILSRLLLAALLLPACSTTRSLHDGEFRLARNKIEVNDRSFNTRELQTYIRQKPNSSILFGWNPFLTIYNWGGQDPKDWMGQFLQRIGQAPVVYDPNMVEASINNMLNHLEYIGYYGSAVKSEVRVHKREVNVTYHVTLGKRYPVSSLRFDLPDSEEFRTDFEADRDRVTIKPGQFLAAADLEAESERSAQYFRTKGYYGFSKTQYFFVADTLTEPGKAALTMSIREYARNTSEQSAVPIRKYRLGDVLISYDRNLRIRPSALENLNILRPGQYYDESAVNRTYARLSALHVFNGVNIQMDQRDSARVDCRIDLRHSRLQGFKINLEASTNSTGLMGISPQLSYFHKNIFHGGERLNISLKGNFQFKPREDVRSTEFTFSSGVSFPQFIGLPNRLFTGTAIPRTDVTTAFNYQNRPEVHTEVLVDVLHMLKDKYKIDVPIFISENGMPQTDTPDVESLLNDQERIDYIKGVLKPLRQAMDEGIDVRGYYLWSLMDNFEWSAGYEARYGVYYTNYETLERIPKMSAKWYANVIAEQGFED